VTSRHAAAQRLSDLARLRCVRDRIDREYAQPLDVEALARGAYMSAGHFTREFRLAYGGSPYRYLMTRTAGMPSCVAKQVTRPIRNREARTPEPQLA
jgi:AraC-like DNA-binding protein